MSRPIEFALPWHTLGHANLGVDALARADIAILTAAVASLGRTAHFTTIGLGANEAVADIPSNVTIGPSPSAKLLLKGDRAVFDVIRRADLVVDISEGDSFADIYGFKRFAYHFGTKAAAVKLGKPLIIAPQTIGPFANGILAKLALWVMNRATAVFARDHLSREYLEYLGVRSRYAEYIDVAFRLPFSPAARKQGRGFDIGINVSGLLYRGGYTGRNELGMSIDYRQFTHRLIADLAKTYDAKIHLVPHVISAGAPDDDIAPVAELREMFPDLVVAPVFESASAAKSYMSGLDLMIAGRMHACIGSFSAGVPVIPIAYSRKFNGLFSSLDYPFYIDGKKLSTDEALAQTLAWAGELPRLAASVAAGNRIANERLDAYTRDMADLIGMIMHDKE